MSQSRSVPTPAKSSAVFLAWGVILTLAAFALLLASGYFGILDPPSPGAYGVASTTSVVLAWFGWGALVVGLGVLSTGVLRLAQHADRAAGITYPAGTQPSVAS